MQNIQALVTRYLEKHTQYAIQLVGPWGIGKTFYYKNGLEKRVTQAPTFHDHSKTYRAIYVSLFGLNSVDQIQNQIFHDLLFSRLSAKTGIRKRVLHISSSLGKLIIDAMLAYKGIPDSKDFLPQISDTAKNLVHTKDLFICFDDLERRSAQLSMEEFTGYVNMLTEENVKVLIICNEDRLNDDQYRAVKEKVVGITLHYRPDPPNVIHDIIASRYAGSPSYSKFLDTIQALIVEVSEKNNHNYRTLIYALDILHDIYSVIRKEAIDIQKDYTNKCEELLPEIARYTLATAIEFKKSAINFTNIGEMQNLNWHIKRVMRENRGAQQDEQKTLSEVFVEKYYALVHDYHFIDSIFGYATGAKEFSFAAFEQEFKAIYHLDNGKVAPEYKVFNSLTSLDSHDFSIEVYRDYTMQLIEYAKKGKYTLLEVLSVYYMASRFDNLLNLDLDALTNDLLHTMTRISEDSEAMKREGTTILQWESGSGMPNQNMEKLRAHGVTIIKAHAKQKGQESTKNLVRTFTEDLDNLYNRYHTDREFQEEFTHRPVLAGVDPDALFSQLIAAKPTSIMMLMSLLKDRYGYGISYSTERAVVIALILSLSDYLQTYQEKSIRTFKLAEFHKFLVDLDARWHSPESV